jgi:arginine deiminase
VNPDRNNFAPRFGMAYRLRNNTTLRPGVITSYARNETTLRELEKAGVVLTIAGQVSSPELL